MAARTDLDRISELAYMAGKICAAAELLQSLAAEGRQQYTGYGGDAWANAVADGDYTTSGIEKAKLKTAFGTDLDALAPLSPIKSELYHVEK